MDGKSGGQGRDVRFHAKSYTSLSFMNDGAGREQVMTIKATIAGSSSTSSLEEVGLTRQAMRRVSAGIGWEGTRRRRVVTFSLQGSTLPPSARPSIAVRFFAHLELVSLLRCSLGKVGPKSDTPAVQNSNAWAATPRNPAIRYHRSPVTTHRSPTSRQAGQQTRTHRSVIPIFSAACRL